MTWKKIGGSNEYPVFRLTIATSFPSLSAHIDSKIGLILMNISSKSLSASLRCDKKATSFDSVSFDSIAFHSPVLLFSINSLPIPSSSLNCQYRFPRRSNPSGESHFNFPNLLIFVLTFFNSSFNLRSSASNSLLVASFVLDEGDSNTRMLFSLGGLPLPLGAGLLECISAS